MSRLRLWLLASAFAFIGCGAQVPDDGLPGDGDSGAVEASRDRQAPDESDSVGFRDGDFIPTSDGTADASSDAHGAEVIDAREKEDVAADIQGDAHDDVAADIQGDAHDVSVDTDAPSRMDEGGLDAGIDLASDADAGGDECTAVTCDLVALSVYPLSSTLIARTTRWMQAMGFYADGSTRDLTTDVFWSSSQPSVALLSNVASRKGLLTGVAPGSVTVTAEVGMLSATSVVQITASEPRLIQIRPPVASMAQGTRLPLAAIVTFADGSQADWSSSLAWSTSAPAVATMNADGIASGLTPGTTTITASLTGLTGSTTLTVTAATLSILSMSRGTIPLPLGLVLRLGVIAAFSDGSKQDVTDQAVWASSDTSHVTVGDVAGAKGKITGGAIGSATVTAAFGGMSAAAAIDVTAAVLQRIETIPPPNGLLMLLMEMQMVSSGRYSDGSSFEITNLVTWSSRDPSVIEASGQRIVARGEGSTEIMGTYAGIEGTLLLEVRGGALDRIVISPNPASAVARGAAAFIYATGYYADGTFYNLSWFAGWSTLDPTVAWIESSAWQGPSAALRGVKVGTTSAGVAWAGVAASSTVIVTSTRR
jgi:hypothetical protein